MTIKEKLEKLDYSDVFDLWTLWILGNAEPPDKWLIIYELSDLAEMDADAAKELSDEIDKLLCPITGEQAKQILKQLLSDGTGTPYAQPYVTGYYKVSDNVWIAFDNRTKECWVEEYPTEAEAKAYCVGSDAPEAYNQDESPIIVTIQGGCIYAVDNVPSDKTVEVRDYDIQDDTSDNVKEDDDGEKYILSIY